MKHIHRRFYLAVFALLGVGHGHASNEVHSTSGPASHESCAIDPKAIVSDACASYSTLDRLNIALQPSIKALTHDSDFFSYYRLNLYNTECPFWDDENSMCGNIACAVNTIENEEDIPAIWRADELGKLEGPKASHPSRRLQKERQKKPLLGELGVNVGESCVVEYDDECDERDYCVPEDESATSKGDYVSLVDNPERFTGYSGPSAQMVWEAIYRENCFSRDTTTSSPQSSSPMVADPFGFSSSSPEKLRDQAAQDLRYVMQEHDMDDNEDECLEKRVFYRIISGMHASISTHLCYDHLNQTSGAWGPNLACYESRLHDYPDRISNLYFNYALVLRALAKVRPALHAYTFCSGDPSQDALTKQKILALADRISSGPQIYDESLMFADTPSSPSTSTPSLPLKEDFRNRFRNVSRTMDCVGCDKCRLWGKLQTAGYGTALKILFEFDDHHPENNPPLRRTELVALVNTLDKISGALSALGHFQSMHQHTSSPSSSSRISPIKQTESPISENDGSPPQAPPPEKSFLRTEFEREFGDVYRTTKWVLAKWVGLPREILTLLLVQLVRLWDSWLGISGTTGVRPVSFEGWRVRYPPPGGRDEV